MTKEEKAIHGILYADGAYESLPVYYLSREWEYYPDVLLTPEDDLEQYYFRYLSIGEFGGLELDDRDGNLMAAGLTGFALCFHQKNIHTAYTCRKFFLHIICILTEF